METEPFFRHSTEHRAFEMPEKLENADIDSISFLLRYISLDIRNIIKFFWIILSRENNIFIELQWNLFSYFFFPSLFRYSSWLNGVWKEFLTNIQWNKSREENRISDFESRTVANSYNELCIFFWIIVIESNSVEIASCTTRPSIGIKINDTWPVVEHRKRKPIDPSKKEDPLSFTRETRVREPLKRKTRARISSKSENFVDHSVSEGKSLSDFKDWIKT